MSGAAIIAAHAWSPLGAGDEAYGIGPVGERAVVAIHDDPCGRAEGLLRPRAARILSPVPSDRDRATELLLAALRGCVDELDRTVPIWRSRRVGLVVGTSSGAMASAQRFFAAWDAGELTSSAAARGATYFAPVEQAIEELGIGFTPVVQVLGACASSTLAVGIALRWLQLERCDVVIAAGFDALTSFVTAGFESLSATTATLPRPFRRERDGMALGEGAAAIALARQADAWWAASTATSTLVRGYVVGFGASTDALHLTAPDRTGLGLAQSARAALTDAGVSGDEIDFVSAHATATQFNDAAEARALALALGDGRPHTVHPLKAQVGHTLGAAGLLETMAMVEAIRRGVAPAAAGDGEIDPACAVPLRETTAALPTRFALKLSSAFAGANASLVVAPGPVARPSEPCTFGPAWGARRTARSDVYLRCHASVRDFDPGAMSALLARQHPHPHRPDAHAKLAMAAVQALRFAQPASPAAIGLVVGHTLATLEPNHAFEARRRTRGARWVEPRRFPATSPNAVAGECAIMFRLRGPSFAVGASLHGGLEALAVARDLIAAGDADGMLVVGLHLGGPVSAGLLARAYGLAVEPGASAAYLHAERGVDGVRLPASLPPALDARAVRGGAGLVGPVELATYLRTLKAPMA